MQCPPAHFLPRDIPAALCGFHIETVSHLLNGCRQHKNSGQKRHNRALGVIEQAVKDTNVGWNTLRDTIVQTSHFGEGNIFAFEVVAHTRPDLCIVNWHDNTCVLVEVAVPVDCFIDERYSQKFKQTHASLTENRPMSGLIGIWSVFRHQSAEGPAGILRWGRRRLPPSGWCVCRELPSSGRCPHASWVDR